MEIRSYQPGDEGDVVELWLACELVVPWNNPLRDIQRKLDDSPEWLLVGILHESLVATVMAGYEGHRGWVNYLAIDPAYQGRGLGKQMMEKVELLLASQGCPKINLQIRAGNDKVVTFYEALGYCIDPVVSMGKRLEVDTPDTE